MMSTPTDLPDKGLALRLAGFEVRDTVAHITTGIEWGVIARKPIDGTVASNVLRYGTGGLNIDACRVATGDTLSFGSRAIGTDSGVYGKQVPKGEGEQNPAGRFPANVVLDEHAAKEMDEQSGVLRARGNTTPTAGGGGMYGHEVVVVDHGGGDSGGASRFFHTMTRDQFKQHMQQLIDPDFKPLKNEL